MARKGTCVDKVYKAVHSRIASKVAYKAHSLILLERHSISRFRLRSSLNADVTISVVKHTLVPVAGVAEAYIVKAIICVIYRKISLTAENGLEALV